MRRTPVAAKYFGWNYFSPMIRIPEEYVSRLGDHKPVEFTPKRDPKNKWGLHNVERFSMHPSVWGQERANYSFNENKGGAICELPPVPVYRQQIWCMGQGSSLWHHPRIHIKCPRGMTVSCKWCRLKYINMSTDDDHDEDWQEVQHRIAMTPEKMEDLKAPRRTVDGILRESNFQTGCVGQDGEPDKFVYRTVYDPDSFYAKYFPEKCSKKPEVENAEPAAALTDGERKEETA